MSRLALLIYVMAAPTLAGILVVAVLTMGKFTAMSVAAAAIAGFVVALPVAWYVGKQLSPR
jgi:hypothetical protein